MHSTTILHRAPRALCTASLLRLVLAVVLMCVIAPRAAFAQSIAWNQRIVSGPSPRSYHAMAYDSARRVTVLFGGATAGGSNGETWEWSGTTWTQRLVSGPSPRYGHAMVYDSIRQVTVLFGGDPGVNTGETWEWNGSAWSLRASTGPSPRYAAEMAYDSARGVTVLFGGRALTGGFIYYADTWEWNGTTWTQRMVGGPTARSAQAMTFDSSRGVTVMFGGSTNGAILLTDTWEWNGTAWTFRYFGGPSPRNRHAIAFDESRGVSVMFGGYIDTTHNGETWEYNGTGNATWTQRVITGPSPRYQHAMAYDSFRGVTVLFGGYNETTGISGETWELCANSITQQPQGTSVCLGFSAMFTIAASSPLGTVTYQWQKKNPNFINVYNNIFNGPTGNGGSYSGTQSPTLTISSVAPDDLGEYRCVVSSPCGSLPSNDASLFQVVPESIVFHPASQAVCYGSTAAFSVTMSPPNGNFAYQWQKRNPIFFNVYNDLFNGPTGNGGSYSGAQTATLTISGVFPNDLGDYRCVIIGQCQSMVSNDATLGEPPAPFITSGPTVAPGCNGGVSSISITASPAGSTYQWQRYVGPCVLCYLDVSNGPTGNGGILSGAQSPTLTVSNLNLSETFVQYRCIVTGPCANTPLAASADAFFELQGLPLAAAPAPSEVCPGGTASISVFTQNVTSFLWEYYRPPSNTWVLIANGAINDPAAGLFAVASGANTGTLTLSNTTLNNPVAFRFSGGNICQFLAPIETTLSYAGPPVITSHPATTNYCHLQSSSFTVAASSPVPMTYQWQLFHFALNQWINLTDGFYIGGITGLSGTIAGSFTPTLTFTLSTVGSVAPDQPFRCIVSNGCGSTTSNPANLHICISDVNCDGLSTSQDYFDFLTAFFSNSPQADVNTDFQVTSQDYFDFLTAFFNGC